MQELCTPLRYVERLLDLSYIDFPHRSNAAYKQDTVERLSGAMESGEEELDAAFRRTGASPRCLCLQVTFCLKHITPVVKYGSSDGKQTAKELVSKLVA